MSAAEIHSLIAMIVFAGVIVWLVREDKKAKRLAEERRQAALGEKLMKEIDAVGRFARMKINDISGQSWRNWTE